jgi:hypothetical protein
MSEEQYFVSPDTIVADGNGEWTSPWFELPRVTPPIVGIGPNGAKTATRGDWLVTAPKNAEQALSLLSAGVGALTQVELTADEKQRVWALIDKALDAVGEVR